MGARARQSDPMQSKRFDKCNATCSIVKQLVQRDDFPSAFVVVVEIAPCRTGQDVDAFPPRTLNPTMKLKPSTLSPAPYRLQ